MVVQEITKLLEKRKQDLVNLLEYDKKIKLEKQHQIYGAINEIDIFIRTLNYFRDKEIEEEIKEIQLAKPLSNPNLFVRIFMGLKEKFFSLTKKKKALPDTPNPDEVITNKEPENI